MAQPDFNLLHTLDVLLTEGSVARASRRLHLSPSAMSRALARLRETTGDPLLVRAGRGLVATPRALELREQIGPLVQAATVVLRPAQKVNLATLERSFTLRSREGFVETFGPALIARVATEAPGVRLHFVRKLNKDSTPLREGTVDMETGVVGQEASPELRTQALFRDRLIGVVRKGHPLAQRKVTAVRYAAAQHILVARREGGLSTVDEALQALGLTRRIATSVDGFSSALALARASDLVATVPGRHTEVLRAGMHSFALPVATPEFSVALLWHPRMDGDQAHRWLRGLVREVCAAKPA